MKVLVIGARRARARAGVEARASPRVSKVFVAPGNAGTAREDGVRQRADHGSRNSSLEFAREKRSASRWSGRKRRSPTGVVDAFRARGSAHLRADAGAPRSSRARRSSQSPSCAPRDSDGRLTGLSPTPAPRMPTCPSARRADRDQGRRAGRGQRRGGRVTPGRSARSRRHMLVGRSRARPAADRDRGLPRGRGGELHRDGRRQARAPARDQPGPQAACSTATTAPIRAAWALTRRRRS